MWQLRNRQERPASRLDVARLAIAGRGCVVLKASAVRADHPKMARIDELLQRRTDLSTFLVHLTRDGSDDRSDARQNLVSIAESLTLEARTPYGMATDLDDYLVGTRRTQRVVCFTETPLEHVWMLIEKIDGRRIRYAPYGLVFSKETARRSHCNPIWYLDISSRGGRDWLTQPISALIDQALEASSAAGEIDARSLARQRVFEITPLLEQMGPTRAARKESTGSGNGDTSMTCSSGPVMLWRFWRPRMTIGPFSASLSGAMDRGPIIADRYSTLNGDLSELLLA